MIPMNYWVCDFNKYHDHGTLLTMLENRTKVNKGKKLIKHPGISGYLFSTNNIMIYDH